MQYSPIMKKLATYLLLTSLPCWFATNLYSQGCSDAGFCTINSLKPGGNDSIPGKENQLKIGASRGSADHNIAILAFYLEYNRKIGEQFSINAKLTSLGQSGNGISVFGLSDIYLTGKYSPLKNFSFILGGKIPLTDGNRPRNGLSLPMDYQSSLGTFDLIAGLNYEIYKIQLVAAIQQPLIQNNNGYLSGLYPVDSELRYFQSTNKYIRKGDILGRISYPIDIAKNFTVTPSILSIYHLGDDLFTDIDGQEKAIDGSQGLTVNLNAFLAYKINESHSLKFDYGFPIETRSARPDGLTRGYMATLEYTFSF